MAVKHFNQDNFEQEVLNSAKPVMVDFFAEWCGPCKMAGPIMEELAEQYADKLVIGKVDVGQEQKLAQKYGVMSIPTVIIFKDGQPTAQQVGFPGKSGYEAMINKVIGE